MSVYYLECLCVTFIEGFHRRHILGGNPDVIFFFSQEDSSIFIRELIPDWSDDLPLTPPLNLPVTGVKTNQG